MTAVFSTFIRQQLVANANLFNGVHIRAVVFRQAPAFGADNAAVAGAQTVAALQSQLGWVETSGTGWPVTTDVALFVRTNGANHYATFPSFSFTGIPQTEVRAIAFYIYGLTVGGVVNPLVFTTDTPFEGVPVLLNAGDAITANPDTTLVGTPNRYMFYWATPGTGVTAVPLIEGPLALTKAAPPFETSHAQHVWLYPQRANLIANPSFEAPGTNFWASNGTLTQVSGGVPGGGAWFGRASGGPSPIVVESNVFPTGGEERWTIQAKVRGTGKLKIGLLWWDATFNTTYSDWGEDEVWDLQPNAWLHITVSRTGFQTFQGAVRFEVQGSGLDLDEVLVEKDWLNGWAYFDGDSDYGAQGDYSWYGGANLAGQTYSLWYNNKKAIYGRIFGQDVDDDDVLTNEEVEAWGFVYRWVPAGVSVTPHIDVLYVNDTQAPVPAKTAITPRQVTSGDSGVVDPWV